jgi:hypothetical protein
MATNVFFDWAASASRFIDFDVPTAADLNAPLDQVTTGFDAVEVRIDAIDADLAGLTSPVQDQLDAKADITGETYSGTHDFTGATITAPTPTAGDASTKVATTEFVDRIAFTTATGLTAASQAEMEAGTEAGIRAMSPLRVAQAIAAQTDMVYEARATNTVFAAADKNKFIEYTGSFTQTFGSAASLGTDWQIVLKNAFTDSVYLTPSGGATIDGVADFLMYPGEARLIQCDGTNFHSVVLQPFNATYTASGFFFKPPGYKYLGGILWGAGGSGGSGNSSDQVASGGAGGAGVPFLLPAAILSASVTVTIGAGGIAVTDADGNSGGASSFGSYASVSGGGGGLRGATTASAGTSSLATDLASATRYSGGASGSVSGIASANPGGNGNFGGGGGGGGANNAGAGGTSVIAGAGGVGSVGAGPASDGTAPGGGGGGVRYSATSKLSGAGARGELRVWGVV